MFILQNVYEINNIADGGIKQTSINVYQLSYILKKN